MKPPIFDYAKPADLAEALRLKADHGDGGTIIAGGQSLVATLNMRLSSPDILIDIGGVAIATGDYVFGDRDGVEIIPAEVAEQTVSHVEKMMQTENLVRKAILDGKDPKQAYLKYGKF